MRNPLPIDRDMPGVDFSSHQVGVLVGKNGAVLRTQDGGLNWTWIRTGNYDTLNAVHFPVPGTGYIVGSRGAFLRTQDAGLTWEYRWTGTYRTLRDLHFISRDIGFAAGDSGTLLKTVDGGTTWTPKPSGTKRSLVKVRFGSPSAGCALALDSALAYTADGGETWTAGSRAFAGVPRGLKMLDARNGVSLIGSYPAPKDGYHVQRTADGGATWTTVHLDSTELTSMDFIHPDTGFVWGRKGRLLATTDGGRTWTARKSGLADAYSLAIRFLDARHWLVISPAGYMYLTRDAGAKWTNLTSGPRGYLEAIHFPTPSTGYAAGQDGILLKSTDAGATWNRLPVGTKTSFFGIFFTDANHGVAVGGSNHAFLTRDGGATWDSVPAGNGSLGSVQFVSPAVGYAIGQTAGVMRTSDGGATWSLAHYAISRIGMQVHFPKADTGYVLGYEWVNQVHQGHISITTDGGASWTKRNPGVMALMRQAFFLDGKRGYVSGNVHFNGSPGLMFKTVDAGVTWTPVTLPDSMTVPLHMHFTDMDHGMFIAYGGIRYRTENGGRTWIQENTDPTNYTTEAFCRDMETCYLVGPYSLYQWSPNGVTIRRNGKDNLDPARKPAFPLGWKLRYFDVLGRLLPRQPFP